MSRAYWTEQGIQATCPKTGIAFVPLRVQFTTDADGQRCVWAYCRFCDALGHTRMDAAFDPSNPQPHIYEIDQVRYGGPVC